MRLTYKIAAAAAALAMPASLAVLSLPGSAGATGTPVMCSKLSGKISTTIKVTGASCKAKPPKAYKTLTGTSSALAAGGTLNWNAAGGSLTITAPTLTTGPGTCPKGWTEQTADGTIMSGTDAPGATYELVTSSRRCSVRRPPASTDPTASCRPPPTAESRQARTPP